MATMTSDSPVQDSVGGDADEARTAVQRLREQADAVVQRIQPRIAAVSTYAREEPTKALLIAAATGAALMGLVALMMRTSSRSTVPGQRRATSIAAATMAAIRDGALDLADRAQTMAASALDAAQQRAASALDAAKARANDAIDATRKRASDTLDATQKRATDALDATQKRAASAAESVSGSVGDAWKTVREQAAPVVDKVRPQLDAMASYAKEDPARAALGAAAAAALVIGLVALVRHSQDD